MSAPICKYGTATLCPCPECQQATANEAATKDIARRLDDHADGLEVEARKIPLGQSRRGGGLDGASEYNLRMLVVGAWREAAKLARGGA